MRRALSCLLALAFALPAAAQEQRRWLLDDAGDSATLQYGTPESDDVVIAFTCENKQLRISEFVGSTKLTPGQSASLKLSSGTASVVYNGQAVANEMDGTVNVEVVRAPDAKLFALLKSGQQLVIDVAGNQQTVPLRGAAQDVATFERACVGKR